MKDEKKDKEGKSITLAGWHAAVWILIFGGVSVWAVFSGGIQLLDGISFGDMEEASYGLLRVALGGVGCYFLWKDVRIEPL